MNEFQRKAEEIGRSFQTQYSKEWVRGTGRAKLANALLNQMRAARSPEQFERAAYQFKQQIVIPYYREVVYPQGSERERADCERCRRSAAACKVPQRAISSS